MTFNEIDILAYEVLRRFGIKKLPVDLHMIVDQIDSIQIHTFDWAKQCGLYSDYPSDNGVLMRSGNDSIILYNKTHHKHRIRWTIAHELGHWFLDHRNHSDLNEAQANRFARSLLIPIPVLKTIGVNDPLSISKLCKVSPEASKYALEEIHHCVMYQPLLSNMCEYIKDYNDMMSCFLQVKTQYNLSYSLT